MLLTYSSILSSGLNNWPDLTSLKEEREIYELLGSFFFYELLPPNNSHFLGVYSLQSMCFLDSVNIKFYDALISVSVKEFSSELLLKELSLEGPFELPYDNLPI